MIKASTTVFYSTYFKATLFGAGHKTEVHNLPRSVNCLADRYQTAETARRSNVSYQESTITTADRRVLIG